MRESRIQRPRLGWVVVKFGWGMSKAEGAQGDPERASSGAMHRPRAEEKTARRETQRAPRRTIGFARAAEDPLRDRGFMAN